jgi:prepilin-type processing-associated H-X9-DG protein
MSIICLMMSLLLPSLTHAQKQGEQIHCLANQRQVGLAWQQLVSEHDDHIPTLHDPEPLRPYIYVYGKEVFLCKSFAGDNRGVSARDALIESCYGFAETMSGGGYDSGRYYHTLHSVRHPGEQLLLTDVEPDPGMTFRPVVRSRGRWMWRPWPGLVAINPQNMTARHSDGCNMTFVDGHGSYTRWRDPRTLKFIKGTIADPRKASVDNPDLRYVVYILGDRRDANE